MTNTPAGDERRKHPRVPKKIMLRFRGVAPETSVDRTDLVGIMVEVSRGGMTLRSPRAYAPGSILQLQLPETELGPARTMHFKVLWQRRVESSTQYDVGGGFVRYTPQAGGDAGAQAARSASTTQRYKTAAIGVSTGKTGKLKAPDDRRQHTRVAQKIYVKYRCVSKGPFHEIDERVGVLLDFSRSGFAFAGIRDYPRGNIIEVKFPETPLGPAATLHAKVVRTQPHDRPAQFRVGCAWVKAE